MTTAATDLEQDLADVVAPKLTQEDYDRAYKLDAGIKKLAIELAALKERIIAEAPAGKSTKVYGKVVVKTGTRDDKDVDAMTEKYPFSEHPAYYKTVLDPTKVAKLDPTKLLFKPTISTISITFAD